MKALISIAFTIVFSCCAWLNSLAENTLLLIDLAAPNNYIADHEYIHYDSPVTVAMEANNNIGTYSAQLQSMLGIPTTVFSPEKISDHEHRVYNDYEYETSEDYYVLEDGSTLLFSSNGSVVFSTSVGAALFQLYNSYNYELTPMSFTEITDNSAIEVVKELQSAIPVLPQLQTPVAAYGMTNAQAIKLALQFDADYASYFSKKHSSLEQILANHSGDSIYLQFQCAYNGIGLGSYSYMLHGNERIIEMANATAIVCNGKLVYFSLPTVYAITNVVSYTPVNYTFEEALMHFESKVNECLLLENITVYSISFEACVVATGSGQSDYQIQPTWHFSVVPTEVIDNTTPAYRSAALTAASRHFVFNAVTGEWISW